uniref:Leucine-rich repeat-containing N-terminal plant-type domain-containing protein n=1 Tax=Fagus sylvatica TaxID=28930 RepID=A0A2N9FVU3_FAGSY
MKIPFFSWLFLLPICTLFVSFGTFVVSGQCIDDQRDLLIEMKNSLIFDNDWSTKLVRWNESIDCCSWEGVTCSDVGHVVGVNLDSESISGGLHNSSSLFRLQYLQSLSLSDNSFDSSQIPPEFGNLTNLSYLNLSWAGFTGQIPIEISRLTRLITLDLSTYSRYNSNLPDLATLVQNLSELEELYLDGVNISAQGNEWCQALSSSLPNLRVLSMSRCHLSGPLHSSLQKLQSLSIIRLNYNDLSSRLPTLQTLDLSDNELLQGSLPEFHPNGSLQSLTIGNLKSRCNFSGSIPDSMANLTQLVSLDISSNSFTGPIPSFNMAKNLTEIYLSDNSFTGQITSIHWKELQSLEYLSLSSNLLVGSIPTSLFSLPLLQRLNLSNNRFSGQIHEFSNVSSFQLYFLDLSNNFLEGPIPMSLFELRGLEYLILSSNNFSGSLHPNAIQQLRNLSDLDLSYNSLLIESSGANSSLSSFPEIVTLILASCKLKTFPGFLRSLASIEVLDLSDNQIHGEIPNWIWNLTYLQHLNLSYNNLEGSLLNSPPVLRILDLHSNQLQGQLPTSLHSVQYLDLSWNNFSSVIPAFYISHPAFLSLSSNKFHGHIPESICNTASLRYLDLSNNSLSGTIPQCLFPMIPLVLKLNRNNLTGKIYDTFPTDCSLTALNLNGNLLEGVVPKSLSNCTSLEVLDIGNNQIQDAFPCYLKNISTLRILILRSNKFYGSVGCGRKNVTWPMLQIVDLASNNFSGKLSLKSFANSKAMVADNKTQSEFNYLQIQSHTKQFGNTYERPSAEFTFSRYLDAITVTNKGLYTELGKIWDHFTSIDLSCNNLDGPIPEDIGVLKSLYILNLSHNAFTDQIPPSLGKLSQLESLDLSSNKLTGEIPIQLADGLIFLGLYGCPLKKECTSAEPRSPPRTFEDIHSKIWAFD